MSNYNYNFAQLILFASTQYENIEYLKPDEGDNNSLIKDFVHTIADGYILMPKTLNTETDIDLRYRIDNISNNISDCITGMKDFIEKILTFKSNAIFWLGTPELNSDCYSSNLSKYNEHLLTLKNYILSLKSALEGYSNNYIWENHVKGILFNQESIYNTSFNYYDLGNANNYEFKLMNDFSYCVHNSITSGGNSVSINKDLIWIPYLSTQPINGITEEKVFACVGSIIAKSTCFDCAFIQSHLIAVGNMKLNNNSYSDLAAISIIDTEPFKPNREHAIANIEALCHSMDDSRKNILFYRKSIAGNFIPVAEPLPNLERECIVGVEYEYNGNIEDNNNIIPENSIFAPYHKYDEYWERRPRAFYWQAHRSNMYKVVSEIEAAYNQDEYIMSYNCSINANSNEYSDYMGTSSGYKSKITYLNTHFTSPTVQNVEVIVGGLEINKDYPEILKNNIAQPFIADNPDKYWIRDLKVSVTELDDDYISKAKFTVVYNPGMTSETSNYTAMINDAENILTSLNITPISSNNGNLVLMPANNDPVNAFIRIHDWLITNVTLTTELTNIYWNCTYGAIRSTIRKATSKGFAFALSYLCRLAGIPCVVMSGTKSNTPHFWNYVKLSGKWQFVDASLNIPTVSDPYKYKYFLRPIPDSYQPYGLLPKVSSNNNEFILFGDIDLDGQITSADAACAQQHVLTPSSYPLTPLTRIAADVTGSGSIGSEDVSCIMQKALTSSYVFPVETLIESYT